MLNYLLKRIVLALISLFVAVTIVFFMMKAIPGLPVTKGIHQTNESFHTKLISLGLAQPISVQYFSYLSGIFHGNFGLYYTNAGLPVTTAVFRVMPYTLVIMGIVYLLSIMVGMMLGILSAYYRGRFVDTLITGVTAIIQAIPLFVLIPIFVWLLTNNHISSKFYTLDSTAFTPAKLLNVIWPILILVLAYAPGFIYFLRNELSEQLNLDYVKVALAKGNSRWVVLFKHALRNSIIPLMYIIVPGFILVISGSVIAEVFFGIPGYAQLLVNSVQSREYNIVLFQVLFFSLLYYVLSIFVDFLVVLIDPRIKLAADKWNSWNVLLSNITTRWMRLLLWLKVLNTNNYLALNHDDQVWTTWKQNQAIKGTNIITNHAVLLEHQISKKTKYVFANNKLYRVIVKKA